MLNIASLRNGCNCLINLIRKLWPPILLSTCTWVLLTTIVFPSAGQITHGFAAYYAASRLVMEQRGGPIFYDDAAFQAEVAKLTDGQASDIYWANPPTTALMFMPLATFSITAARRVWTGISFFLLFLSAAILGLVIFKASSQTGPYFLASAILLLSVPVAKNFQYGQAYILLLAFFTLALLAFRSGRDGVAGLFLGLTLALKASGLPILVLLTVRKEWRVVTQACIVFLALILFSIRLVGFSTWQAYFFDALPGYLSSPVIAVTAYQTIPGILRHLFMYHASWNPDPLINWPVFASVVGIAIALQLVRIAGLRSRRMSREWLFCMGLILSVILVPTAEEHHYVLLYPAFLLAVNSPTIPKTLLFAATALIALPLDYETKALTMGWWALLAYPRLYGAVLLFIALYQYEGHQNSYGPEADYSDAFSRA